MLLAVTPGIPPGDTLPPLPGVSTNSHRPRCVLETHTRQRRLFGLGPRASGVTDIYGNILQCEKSVKSIPFLRTLALCTPSSPFNFPCESRCTSLITCALSVGFSALFNYVVVLRKVFDSWTRLEHSVTGFWNSGASQDGLTL